MTLKQYLETNKMTQSEFSRLSGIPVTRINEHLKHNKHFSSKYNSKLKQLGIKCITKCEKELNGFDHFRNGLRYMLNSDKKADVIYCWSNEQVDYATKRLSRIKLKMYKQKQEIIEMKESQLALLESARIKTSKPSDESGGAKKDIYDQLEGMLVKKEELRLEIIKLKLELAAVDTALKLMSSKGKLMEEAKMIIELRHIEDKSLMEIQIDLDMSESTVKRRLKKGEKEFARLLKMAS